MIMKKRKLLLLISYFCYSLSFSISKNAKNNDPNKNLTVFLCPDGRKVQNKEKCNIENENTLDFKENGDGEKTVIKDKFKIKDFSKDQIIKYMEGYKGYFHIKFIILREYDCNVRLSLKMDKIGEDLIFKISISKVFLNEREKSLEEQSYFIDTEEGFPLFEGKLEMIGTDIFNLKYSNNSLKSGLEEYRKFVKGLLVADDYTRITKGNKQNFDFDKIYNSYPDKKILSLQFRLKEDKHYKTEVTNRVLDNLISDLRQKGLTSEKALDKIKGDAIFILDNLFEQSLIPIISIREKFIGFEKDNKDLVYISSPKEFIIEPSIVFNKDITYHIVTDKNEHANKWWNENYSS